MPLKKLTFKDKRRVMLLGPLALLIMFLILFNFTNNWYQIYIKNNNKQFLKEQLLTLEEEEYELNKQVQRLQDPEYVARYAREKFLYSRDGEILIKIK
ncbi:MAG: septum formation initiator family protein [Bacilli bacterium]|nr:septum formation initiator family protein [Bacilli bacterium]